MQIFCYYILIIHELVATMGKYEIKLYFCVIKIVVWSRKTLFYPVNFVHNIVENITYLPSLAKYVNIFFK